MTHIPKFILITTLLSLLQASAIPSCKSDRPGSQSHRTLYITESSLSDTKEDDKWTDVLCCLYTHVRVKENKNWDGWLELYDGSWESTNGDTLPEMAEDAYNQICNMSMGSKDCENRRSCIEDALS